MKFTLLLLAFFSVQLSAQNISGCITSMPDSISNIKVAYVRGKGLAVKQEILVKNGCFNAAWEHPEQGIFIVYIDGEDVQKFTLELLKTTFDSRRPMTVSRVERICRNADISYETITD